MASCVTIPYSVDLFNQLPGIDRCDKDFCKKNGVEFVHTIARKLVWKYGLANVFGFVLLHRHFALREDEKLVEHNNVTTPWDDSEKAKEHRKGGTILPDAWMVTGDDSLMAYEFSFSPMNKRSDVDYESKDVQSFISEFTRAVQEAGLEKIIGLRRWPEDFKGGMERTEGRANVFFGPGEYDEADAEKSIPTMWFFPSQLEGGPPSDARCTGYCPKSDGEHLIDYNTPTDDHHVTLEAQLHPTANGAAPEKVTRTCWGLHKHPVEDVMHTCVGRSGVTDADEKGLI